MKQRPRIYYAQLFDRNHSSISRILTETGGIGIHRTSCTSKPLF